MEYCWETHAHTAEISPCGEVPAARLAQLYIEAGYTGVVVTNHLCEYGLGRVKDRPWQEQIDWFFAGADMVREAAGDRLRVLTGAELRFTENINDYLVFGMTKEWLLAHPDVFSMGVQRFHEEAQANGFLLVQAHPFRNGMTVANPQHLDGVEVYNGHIGHDSRNDIAAAWARKYGLFATSGSDFHQEPHAARGGIITKRDIRTMDDMIAAIKEGVALKTTL